MFNIEANISVRQMGAVRKELPLKENWWSWTVMGHGSGHLEYPDQPNDMKKNEDSLSKLYT